MPKIGSYCRAYRIGTLRQFPGWTEKAENARKQKKTLDGVEVQAPRELTDDGFLYIQEDYSVTDEIYLDENVIYDQLTPEWKEFCQNVLKFEVPSYAIEAQAAADQSYSEGAVN
jgi:hypothetical protein